MKIERVLYGLAALGAVFAVVLALSGCLFTGRPPLILEDNPIQRATAGDFRATIRFMDDGTLEAKYRKEANPFISDSYPTLRSRLPHD